MILAMAGMLDAPYEASVLVSLNKVEVHLGPDNAADKDRVYVYTFRVSH